MCVEGRVRNVEMDFAFNPLPKRAHGDGFGFLVLQDCRRRSVRREALGQSTPLVFGLESCNFEGMGDCQLSDVEGVLGFIDEMDKAQTGVHIFLGAPDFLGEGFDCVGVRLQLHERGITARLVEFVHIGALQVLDELQFEAFGVGEFADASGNGLPLGKL